MADTDFYYQLSFGKKLEYVGKMKQEFQNHFTEFSIQKKKAIVDTYHLFHCSTERFAACFGNGLFVKR